MNILDIVLIVALVGSALAGLYIGIIKAALSLVGIIVGVFLAGQFYEPLAELLTFMPEDVANIAAFVLILVGVIVVAGLVARLLKLALKMVLLGWVDKVGGAVVGFLVGAIIWSIILATWVQFFGSDLVTDSALAEVLLDKFPFVLALLPEEFDAIRDFFQ
jgi:membrane protein required for colicin V production